MKHDAFNMIPKANNKVCNGNSQHLHNARNIHQNHKWRHCSSLSLISRVLFNANSFHKAKQSTKPIMWKYWSGYMKLTVHVLHILYENCDNFQYLLKSLS